MTPAPILHRAPGFIAVDKPPGTTVIPGRDAERADSLAGAFEAALGQRVWVVHRLDRDTSGVLLLALDAPTHRALSMAFEGGAVEKTYLALVHGAVEGPLDLDVALVPARRGRMRPARAGEEGGRGARTRVRPLERFGDRATLVEARPLTGRTHQIRVHLRSAGHPLLVDHQYGAKTEEGDRLLFSGALPLTRTPLHAARLRLRGVPGVQDVEVEAPLPEDMAQTVAHLRSLTGSP